MVLRSSHVRSSRLHILAGAGCAALLIAAAPLVASAQSAVASFNIRPAPLSQSLLEFGRQAGISIAADQTLTSGLRGRAVSGDLPVDEALDRLLVGTGLSAEFAGPNAVRLVRTGQGDAGGNDLQPVGQDPFGQEPTTVEDIVVTAQKREESIQDVPIAVSAFSAENLDAMKIEGGSELFRAVPNVTFSKANFSMYNFSIRGIGTKAVSASSDPAVAVSFNNSPLIRNRLFEQEYLDVNRVEVLRGPQGTLYGRNATAGVVNMIPNLPGPDFEAMLKAEAGNYGAMRGQMMLNIPLTDTFWVRGAAALTKRDGYDHNTFNDTWVNGRDLYSTRLSAAWEPTDNFRANLIWEHFGEDDNRSRTGKQLCTRDPGPSQVRTAIIPTLADSGRMSQGCLPGSLYDDAAYGTPNASGMSQLFALSSTSFGRNSPRPPAVSIAAVDPGVDPYAGVVQSRNLREIATSYDPKYIADNDVYQLNVELDLSDSLTLVSQTVYAKDNFWSTQDYSRFISNDIFNDSSRAYDISGNLLVSQAAPEGVYTDPQLGPSRRMESADLSRSDNRQFYQEFRIQSGFDGPANFTAGANYLDFKSEDDYFVFNNTFTYLAEYFYGRDLTIPAMTTRYCQDGSTQYECIYVDYSPIGNLAGDGHNYFRSKNKVHTRSWAVFADGYVDIRPDIRITAGLRYTEDKKTATPYPSQLLLGTIDSVGYGPSSGGNIARGFVALPDIDQAWQALTGRAVIDWNLTEDAMVYASYSRGYKGGGANPPRADINTTVIQYQPLAETFEPEYVNAFEVGGKFQTPGGAFRLNATAFYYDYTDYQVSQIVDRISLNENFDATSMGLEFEAVWRPTRNFRIDANLGLLKTRIGDGESSIDVMNRTQGNDDWVVLRPWIQVPSNCVAPAAHVETIFNSPLGRAFSPYALAALCGGAARVGSYDPAFPAQFPFWSLLGITYNPLTDAPNGGRGFEADLSGNELPNAPRMTASIGAQYTWNIGDIDLTPRIDYYSQSSSYFRVYNTEYDRIRSFGNLNMSITARNMNIGLVGQFYVKNVLDDASIVDAFTNSDDSMLTTNVFVSEPRLYGFSITKRF